MLKNLYQFQEDKAEVKNLLSTPAYPYRESAKNKIRRKKRKERHLLERFMNVSRTNLNCSSCT